MDSFSFEQKQDIGLSFVLDLLEPACPYGAKLLNKPRFYTPSEKAELENELDNVSIMLSALNNEPEKVAAVRHSLSTLKDVSGSIENCASGALDETELFELTAFLLRVRELIPLAESLPNYENMEGTRFECVKGPLSVLDPKNTGRLSFFVEDSRTPELMRLRRKKRELEEKLRLPEADKDAIIAERIVVTSGEERELLSIYKAMSDALRPLLPILDSNAAAAGRLDAAISKAHLARRFDGIRPQMGGETLAFEEAINPEIAEALNANARKFTPITIELPKGVTILTGANMGGKSVAVKTIALNASLALMGFFVFCKGAAVPLFDRTELINRDFSSTVGGLSSFGGEIIRFNEAVDRLRDGGLSFIAMDEFARGTNSEEGAAIVRGVVKFLNDKNAVTILATHHDGAAEFASRRYQVHGLLSSDVINSNEKSKSISTHAPPSTEFSVLSSNLCNYMNYGLVQVDKSAEQPHEALRICRLLGMDKEIINDIEGGTI